MAKRKEVTFKKPDGTRTFLNSARFITKKKRKINTKLLIATGFFWSNLIIFVILMDLVHWLIPDLNFLGILGALMILATSAYWVALSGHLFIKSVGKDKKWV